MPQIYGKTSDEATSSLERLVAEFIILQCLCNNQHLDLPSRTRLMTIRELRRSQAIGTDPALFVEAHREKLLEWGEHWTAHAPTSTLTSSLTINTEDSRTASLSRLTTEIAILEFHVTNAGLTPRATRSILRTIERRRMQATNLDLSLNLYPVTLAKTRKEWAEHQLEWGPSFDELGRVEYGVVFGTGELMVGRLALTRRVEEGKVEEVLEAGEVVEMVGVELERLGREMGEEVG